jgi:hypothetical protein
VYPTIPWVPEATPVVRVVSAAAVVVGNPDHIELALVRPALRVRACPALARRHEDPSPSTTRTTAPLAGGRARAFGFPLREATQLGITSARLGPWDFMAGSMVAIL